MANILPRVWTILKRFEARVLIGLFLVAATLLAFLGIAEEMAEGETRDIDSRLILALRSPGDLNDPIGSHGVEEAVRDITALGGTTLVVVVTLVAVLAFVFHKKRIHAVVMAGAVVAAWASSQFTKGLFSRPRPDLVPHEVYVYTGSFPSGHSTMSTAAFLTLAMLIASLEMKRRSKALALTLAALIVVSVGFSRVYLGVHWPSDVLAGWCLGAGWALVGWLALRLLGGQTRGAG
ncbi:phosphatase PAP2 family protein [Phenylobacterium sp.]|uniref:phosphatase PAP2 family protein n=1 Tax=Phenylobacterium sp. TaxID=1871053 RepID=UPI001200EFA1|nr:phosphatase PAP2 family protein [Phenylobacterium sp.]TAL28822.1 MAG: phosphatase PAP2 family protein [Phenylobacterium sp.]